MKENQYSKKEVICPIIGKICDKKEPNCDICIALEDKYQIEESLKSMD